MNLSSSVTFLLISITGLVYGSEFDDWCGLHFGYVHKPWALCGRAKYPNDDPKQGIWNWDLQPQDVNLCTSTRAQFHFAVLDGQMIESRKRPS
ncbi:hypothetical protein MJO28_004682 [Puccinia striiformis f. sp. tritici]|uniref:Uncharacterized protein n=1 Tax=Puccinia striiformis f. sp. tritici TaxID=168172 RepID=A0ACC0EPR6_9BASI|nr:uncharacterized protein Pst134EA_031886 [Puccinia striiformis f. sp. tritici]KAH9444453.1 hypothetical protein Pst134EA_031886 [Puccinia striiformis f. sp. tritici]KAH9459665.1 hypothetical protein Pst134EB_007895 [Puccinia striiformis f. sp. tritici]KAI7957587.1 hypothetical protein MJO28_004682 [Puccinia striiformis f. sp. tritici]KAI9616656.1 hypothetical protein KEM48_005166 [Puccinia striiformis f. sp. tritici PST-130]